MKNNHRILCLCGGVGGAKLAFGFSKIISPENLSIAINTGDDFIHLDLPISPDIDTVIYTLSGLNNQELGWGLEGETWEFMDKMEAEGKENWFRLGDRDIKTHKIRKQLLLQGKSLSDVTQEIANFYGVQANILPMADTPVPTIVHTKVGPMPFQHYFVKYQCAPQVTHVEYCNASTTPINPLISQTIEEAELDAIVICPSNPYLSIDPILSLKGMRELLQQTKTPVVAVSPIVNGQAIKGPTAKIMNEMDVPATASAITQHYDGLIDIFILDETDPEKETIGNKVDIKTLNTKTIMKNDNDKIALATFILENLDS